MIAERFAVPSERPPTRERTAMKPVTAEVLVEAQPERVFQLFTDFEHAAERARAIESVEMLTHGPTRVGTRFRETRVMFGRRASETMEVAELEPGRGYVLTAESCGARYRTAVTFTPERGGAATRVRATFEGTPVSLMARLLTPLMGFMAKACARALEADCADLKAACEGRGPRADLVEHPG
jgi:uncharacterized protein YndB with AHSA1/START domain